MNIQEVKDGKKTMLLPLCQEKGEHFANFRAGVEAFSREEVQTLTVIVRMVSESSHSFTFSELSQATVRHFTRPATINQDVR